MADVEPPPADQGANEAPQGLPIITQAFGNISAFFAAYGWYMVAGFVVFSFIWKNLEERIARFQRSIEDGRIKKDPDTINKMEEERFARLERLQKELDEKALIKKAREDEIAAERAEREKLRQNLKGRASVARYEEEKAGKAGNSSKETAKKSTSGAKQRGSTFKRSDYNPLTGAGGGSSRFSSGRKGPSRGG
ncbi:unnamed protein product [Oikopleura dioica]|uniref:Selenoprotein S n=1 Tax=Oikopleura dioica TaxID=34765 RepID=E4YG15_OIKDI|nr:unnamed protein product [Oikopleura dioica]